MRKSLNYLLSTGVIAVLAADSGCGIFSGKGDKVSGFNYNVPADNGDEVSIRVTYDSGAESDLQLGLYYLSQGQIDGMSATQITSIQSDRALPYAALWADSNGDAHVTMDEASTFREAAHSYSRGKAIPQEFLRSLNRITRSKQNGVIGSKR